MKRIKAGDYVLLVYLSYYLIVMFSFWQAIHWRQDMQTAFGMAFLIGFALNILRDQEFIKGFYHWNYWQRKWWPTIRICIVPFCVSSFSALGPRIDGYWIFIPLKWIS